MYFLWTKRKNPELSVLGISIRPLIPRVAVFSAFRCCTFLLLLCILIVGIHASRISNPPSLLMLLGSYVNSFLYPTSVPVRISINKLDLIPDTPIVRPKLEYACAAWNPYLQRDINSLERVKRKAARSCTNGYHQNASVTVMIQELGWQTLEQRRKFFRLALLYKISHDLVDKDVDSYLSRHNESRTRRSHNFKYTQYWATKNAYF